MISVLCVNTDSVYKSLPGIDAWDKQRNAYNFSGTNPVITHAPCQQWSQMRRFAKENKEEKELAFFCLEKVNANGGIFEHPAGSNFFKVANIKPTISIDQHWFGFPARKRTWLYFSGYKPKPFPLNFDAVKSTVEKLHSSRRSDTTICFAKWLIDCVS